MDYFYQPLEKKNQIEKMNSEKGLVRELHHPARVNYPRRKIVMRDQNET